jgi:hypothetical protein
MFWSPSMANSALACDRWVARSDPSIVVVGAAGDDLAADGR